MISRQDYSDQSLREQLGAITDAQLQEYLQDADLPSLLVSLAQITGDKELIRDELRPPLELGVVKTPPQGGMSQGQQERARAAVLDAMTKIRDGDLPTTTDIPLKDLVTFFVDDKADAYLDLLAHELDTAPGEGTPKWAFQETPQRDSFRVAVIGAGMSGLAAAYRCRQAGLEVTVFEKNPEVGGTWYENTYPGCRLDTHNYAYAYSFHQKADWPQFFSEQSEILQYFSRFSQDTGLRELTKFSTRVTSARFDERSAQWSIEYENECGSNIEVFDAVISGVGQLNSPQLPNIEGIESFAGASWHTAQWNHDYDLTGKRVAVIGTGASAFQVIPAIAEEVEQLNVYQRNAPWMYPTPRYHDDISDSQLALFRLIPGYAKWYRFLQFWTAVEGRRKYALVDPNWVADDSISAENDLMREEFTEYLREQFAERPDLLEKVVPTYPPGAKRLLRDNGTWAETLKRSNVDLITEGIRRITPTGIETVDGEIQEVDVIIHGTGFSASDFLSSYEVTGISGMSLQDYWDGEAQAYLGITVPNFPNMFLLYGPNTNLVVNGSSVFLVELAVEYAVEAIRTLLDRGDDYLDVKQDAYDRFVIDMDQENRRMAWGAASVSSWYKNKSGRVTQIWPYPLIDYWNLTRRVVATDYHFGQAWTQKLASPELVKEA